MTQLDDLPPNNTIGVPNSRNYSRLAPPRGPLIVVVLIVFVVVAIVVVIVVVIVGHLTLLAAIQMIR